MLAVKIFRSFREGCMDRFYWLSCDWPTAFLTTPTSRVVIL